MTTNAAGTAEKSYASLLDKSRDIALLQSVSWLLSWDQETVMPPAGAEHRAKQMALLAGLAHDRISSKELADLLHDVEQSAWLASAGLVAQGNVSEIRRVHDRAVKVPKALVEELARTIPISQTAWAQAKRASDFAAFKPHLEKMVKLKREEAKALAAAGADLYDALLSEFEPGMSTSECEKQLDQLASGLVPLVRAIAEKGNQPLPWAGKTFPVDRQRMLCALIPPMLGLDAQGSRLDVSAHPFSQRVGHGDLRITTRFDERDLRGAYFGVMHETGHALYEQGLAKEHDGTPCGEARSIGVHESQSRLWENLVGRSRAWWTHSYPFLRAMFPEALAGVDADTFYRHINRVEPSPIRVEADEVTYNLHIVMRMRIERRILSGALDVKDVPAAWNEEAKNTLGLTLKNDAEGCLQDVHWSAGAFGYFPTYALGNMYGAQLMEAARKALPTLDADVAKGETRALLGWLVEKVHRRGGVVRGAKIVEDATGKAPDAAAFLRYVEGKFKPLYGLA